MTKEEAIEHLEDMKKGLFLWDMTELVDLCILALKNMYAPKKDTDGDDPMIGIVWYNGLDDIVIKWKDYKKGDDAPYYAYEPGLSDLTSSVYRQLEMVWMYLVLCFGDYGTSPRSGWIEDLEGYKKWFEELEELRKPVM